ncbi:MAG TPA: tyrosine-type recombinase/integrase [Sphingomonas sp.]
MLPKYVKRVRAKGRDYYYFDTGKVADGKKVYARLPDLRSMDFGGSYAAMMGHRNRRPAATGMSVPQMVNLYQRSQEFRGNAASTRKLYNIYLARLEGLLPTAPVAEVTRGDMRRLIDAMAETPGAANAFLKTTGALFAWGEQHEYVRANPCTGIKQMGMGEHQPWPAHILQAALVADDDRVRLLTHLLYFTAQRIGDVLAMGWADIQEGRVALVQEKTTKKLRVRLHEDLQSELARHPRRAIVICTDASGRPLKQGTAGKLLSDFTAKLGHRCVPHGLRKNAVIALLEAGCTVAQTSAVSGQSLAMVEKYAKERDQVGLSDAAVLQWQGAKA